MLSKDSWNNFQAAKTPFLNYEFLNALNESKSIGTGTGWEEAFTEDNDAGILISFIKTHSYGEYIFDWGWAEAYSRHGIPYYPKLTSMIPFTPVTTKHFIVGNFDQESAQKLLSLHDEKYEKGNFSSSHFLFLDENEIELFRKNHYMIRESIQYHFYNNRYSDFENFLSNLKSRKAKTIRHERQITEVEIHQTTGNSLSEEQAVRMYKYYISTIAHKNSFDYLNEGFFKLIFKNLKNNILFIEATKNGIPVAGSLFFYDSEKLYGRYWGSTEFVENLHFELCYYQGIDFCIQNKLSIFEAGAQGEHKIARGFKPVRTYSAHKIKHPAFKSAIADFIETEKKHVQQSIDELSKYLPFH